jgi:glycosyltransferase involved in cell wall biosynthesis
MRVLIFHGYLLGGTGSNVYNARLASALTVLGHEVHLLCQDRHPHTHPFVDAAGDWEEGSLRVRAIDHRDGEAAAGAGRDVGVGDAGAAGGPRGRCTVYRPDIGELLPVYVADRYEGVQARVFAQCDDLELTHYIDANVAAVGEVMELVRPHVALANHLVMGPVILARGLRGEVPYVVKVHGSALEYTVKPAPERFLPFAREGLAGARAVLVGSRHTAASLWAALGDEDLPSRTWLGPPGVDVERFSPREPASAAAGVRALAARLRATGGVTAALGPPAGDDAFTRDEAAAAAAIDRLDPEHDRLVAFVGKLIVSKGVDLLIAAWPLVLHRVPRARLVVVGFGAYRHGLEELLEALAGGELERARAIATAGRALEEGPADGPLQQAQPLTHLLAFLDGLHGPARERYLAAARELPERVVLSGRLDHEELPELLPACDAVVIPSTFPEAFGMVAAEAAACGALPISAAHSGLAEVSAVLARSVEPPVAGWLSFPVDDTAVIALATRLIAWLEVDPRLRSSTRHGLVGTVRERWSWEGVARGVIAAAEGQIHGLGRP